MKTNYIKSISRPDFLSLKGSFIYDTGVYDSALNAHQSGALYRLDGLLGDASEARQVDDRLGIALATLAAVGVNTYQPVFITNGNEFNCDLFYQIDGWVSVDSDTLKDLENKINKKDLAGG